MLRPRVIPVLLLRRQGLVKTTRFRRPEYVGDPINVVRIFNDKEVDEIVLTEIVATREGRGPDFELLAEIATEAFMPLTYGGGVRTVSEALRVLRTGIEKVAVNSAGELGSQCVVASVDIRRSWRGRYEVFSHAGRRVPERDPLVWIEQLVRAGAGEILLNAVDRDGTMRGYDLELLGRIRSRFDVPIIACGGASSLCDMKRALSVDGIDALGVGARFIYEGPHRAVLVSYLSANEITELAS